MFEVKNQEELYEEVLEEAEGVIGEDVEETEESTETEEQVSVAE